MQEERQLTTLNISDILPNRFQPRIKFEDNSLEQLATSIIKYGVLEPIIVRPIGNKYEIIAGERRYKASKLAGKSTIPAITIKLSDKESEELALLENVQRKSLNPIEEAVSYKRILDSGHIGREELSNKIGKPQSEILSKIRLLSLADEVQSYLLNNRISERHARSLLNLNNLNDQSEMLHRIVNERLTVKATDREINKMLEDKSNSEEIEDLFADEKGDSNMDIDRIMREAKDINVPDESEQKAAGPDLMTGGNDIQSEPIVREEPTLPVGTAEPSKFFSSVSQPTPTVSEVKEQPANNGVTFDSMFSSSLLNTDSKPDTENQGISGIVAEAMKKYNNMSENKEENKSTVLPNEKPLIVNTPEVNLPVSPKQEENVSQPAPTVPTPVEDTTSKVVTSEQLVSPTIESPVVEPTVAPVSVEPVVEPTVAPVNVEPVVEPTVAPVNVEPVVEPRVVPVNVEPVVEPTVAPVNVAPVINPSVSTPVVEPKTLEEVKPAIEPTPLAEVTPVNVPTDVTSTSMNAAPEVVNTIESVPQVMVPPVASPSTIENVSVPDVSIIENDEPQTSESVTPNLTEQKVTESSNVPKFARVIKMLRDCADEIERNGYLVNVDEIDMDKQYKVIFTIDKE